MLTYQNVSFKADVCSPAEHHSGMCAVLQADMSTHILPGAVYRSLPSHAEDAEPHPCSVTRLPMYQTVLLPN